MKARASVGWVLGGAVVFAGVLSSCGEEVKAPEPLPITQQDALEHAPRNVEAMLGDLSRGLRFLESSAFLGDVVGATLSAGEVECGGSEGPIEEPPPAPGEEPPRPEDKPPVPGEEPPAPGEEPAPVPGEGGEGEIVDCGGEINEGEVPEGWTDFEEESGSVAEWLSDNVFNAESVESQTDTSVTYLLDPERVCGEPVQEPQTIQPIDENDPRAEERIEAAEEDVVDSCRQLLEAMPVRLVVTWLSEGNVDVAVQLGEGRDTAITLNMHPDRLAAAIDLSVVHASLQAAAETLEDEDIDLPRTLEGALKVELVRAGAQDFTASLSVTRAIAIEAGEGDEAIALALGAAQPALKAEILPSTQTITARADIGTIDLMLPLALLLGEGEDGSENNEIAEIHIGGLNAGSTFTGQSDVARLTGIGLGDDTSYLRADGRDLVTLDINPDDGRRFDLTVSASPEGTRLELTPSVAWQATMAFGALVDHFGMPEWMADETLSARLDGAAIPALLIPSGDETGPADAILKVLAGELTLESRAMAITVSVEANQCLLSEGGEETVEVGEETGEGGEGVEGDGEISHPFSSLEAGLCE